MKIQFRPWIKKRLAERKYRKAAEHEASRREKASYYKAKARESEHFGASRARIEREQREKRLRESYKGGGGFGGALKSIGSGFDVSGMGAGMNSWMGGERVAKAPITRQKPHFKWKHKKVKGKWKHTKVRAGRRKPIAAPAQSGGFGIEMPDFDLGF